MKHFVTLLVCTMLATVTFAKEAKIYGEKPNIADAMTITSAVEKYEDVAGKTIAVTGTVKKVCEQKGCWMAIEDGNTNVRTLFKDYGFFVPKDILNKKVKIQGELKKKEISVSMAKHFAKDEGAPKAEVDKITEPEMTYQFVATGVETL